MIKIISNAIIILCFTLTSFFIAAQDSTRFINQGMFPTDVSPYGRVVVGSGNIWTIEEKQRGNHVVKFNASNLSSGIYFYKLTVGSFSETKNLNLIR